MRLLLKHLIRLAPAGLLAAAALAPPVCAQARTETITLESLVREMAEYNAIARLPVPSFRSLQASSYNRKSVRRGEPGWFADQDGEGFIRTEEINGKTEWVIMEHEGPGTITRMWTPFFYYKFNERKGPNLKVYLDGSDQPVIDAPLIDLVTEHSFIRPPFATFTARAGVSYLPIPFARKCKLTMDQKPFYNVISYRAYPEGTPVRTFTREEYEKTEAQREAVGRALLNPPAAQGQSRRSSGSLGKNQGVTIQHKAAGGAIRELSVKVDAATVAQHPALLRSLILTLTFDGEETVWCPLGDFFSNANALHPLRTWTRSVTEDGGMVVRWVMPFRKDAQIRLRNLSDSPVRAEISATFGNWKWDERSMYFHANWRSDEILPGTPFVDWNFIDISGKGVVVGDSFTVLSPGRGWWGEGDEKIYVDGAWDEGFPTHFGTGTEDYYGWAGGKVPTKHDVFSIPYGANVTVGSTAEDNPRGFNICTRIRALDAIPFDRRLVFDMEASPGVNIRKPWNLLGYSAAVFWYARPGAKSNRPPLPAGAVRPIMSLEDLDRRQDELRRAADGGKK